MEQSQYSPKVFGIGLSKTGTNSLTVALQHLGYSAVHYPTHIEQVKACDAATDIPVADSFEQLDKFFPGSKFILTERSLDDWLESSRRHRYKRQDKENAFAQTVQKNLYGTLGYDRGLFAKAYARHGERVRKHFSNRPDDLLSINICSESFTWDPLCRFLGKAVPQIDFPRTNQTPVTDRLLVRLLNCFGDVQQASEISGVSVAYLKALSQPTDAQTEGTQTELDLDGGRFNANMMVRLVAYFGSVEALAAALNISLNSVVQSLAWLEQDHSQRALGDDFAPAE